MYVTAIYFYKCSWIFEKTKLPEKAYCFWEAVLKYQILFILNANELLIVILCFKKQHQTNGICRYIFWLQGLMVQRFVSHKTGKYGPCYATYINESIAANPTNAMKNIDREEVSNY